MSDAEQTPVADKPASSKPPSSSKPASSKPAGGKKGRPSVGGAKKGAPASTASKFEVGDIVLSRLKGYPPWPSRIANPDILPAKVLSKRPSSSSNIYCVQFFPAGDFSWLTNNLIQPLAQHEITAWLAESHRKNTGGLRDAYQTAQDPKEWDEYQAEVQKANEAAEAEEEVDELEDEEGAESGGKRKRATGDKKASKKKAKVEKNAKPTSKKESKPKSEKKAKPDSKPAEVPNGEDADPLASNPECVRVKSWRHNLQRAFLSKDLPQASEMDSYDKLFSTIENYDGMTVEALQFSKIGKVMKKIAALTEIPRNDELNITSRAQKLMDGWASIIKQNDPKANGHSKEANGDAEPESSAKPPAPETATEETKPAAEEKKETEDAPAPEAKAAAEAEPTPA